ncbi:hypothetical protein pdam_00013139 [Pocillopora damicornis]|uniref:Uncharacterized protein n=1 Tax=Pocillopora damicornis TaxID=46731 RepID=A0A3M6UL36_POCDA|nr:hypothetical protein pdam_00013139 [Pocillopora damicornis]
MNSAGREISRIPKSLKAKFTMNKFVVEHMSLRHHTVKMMYTFPVMPRIRTNEYHAHWIAKKMNHRPLYQSPYPPLVRPPFLRVFLRLSPTCSLTSNVNLAPVVWFYSTGKRPDPLTNDTNGKAYHVGQEHREANPVCSWIV